jgi:hypothetical protein
MSALSDYLENKLLDHLVKATSYSVPATLYVGLFTADPGESGVTGELTIGTGAYARAVVTNNNVNFPLCPIGSAPVKTNGAVIQFPTATTNWGTLTHWAIYDASSAGNMIAHGAFTRSYSAVIGDAPKIAVGAFSLSFSKSSAGGLTEYAQRALLDMVFGSTTFTTAAAVYVGVGTGLSVEAIIEWTESSYSRQSIEFGSASGGVSTNSNLETFTSNVIDGAVSLTHFGLWDDPSAGNLLVVGPVTTSRAVGLGDTATFPASSFTLTLQ